MNIQSFSRIMITRSNYEKTKKNIFESPLSKLLNLSTRSHQILSLSRKEHDPKIAFTIKGGVFGCS